MFNERLGCLEENPPQLTQDFIRSVCGVFEHMSPLLFNPLFKLFPTNDWRQFEKHFGRSLDIGRKIISKVLSICSYTLLSGLHAFVSVNLLDKVNNIMKNLTVCLIPPTRAQFKACSQRPCIKANN